MGLNPLFLAPSEMLIDPAQGPSAFGSLGVPLAQPLTSHQ